MAGTPMATHEGAAGTLTASEVAGLFGDAMTQEDLQKFLAEYAETEADTEAQGSLVTIASYYFSC